MLKNAMTLTVLIVMFNGCASLVPSNTLYANSTSITGNTATPKGLFAGILTPISPTRMTTVGEGVIQQCLQIKEQEISLKDVTSGTLLLFPSLLDVRTGKKYKLPAQQAKIGLYGDAHISPDGNSLAYIEDIQNNEAQIVKQLLWVVDARANVIAKISFEPGKSIGDPHRWGNPRWLDNERLILDTNIYEDLVVVNPFTREQRTVFNDLPMLYKYSGPGGPWWRVEYSPDLEWVAYFYMGANKDGQGPWGTVIRDLVKGQDLWQSKKGDEGEPVWSFDGVEVAVIGDGQLYLVKRSGQAKPVLPDSVEKQASSSSWSPDNQQISFWNYNSLMVYDKQTDKVVDLCIPGDAEIPLPHPLWSPDGKQIIVRSRIPGTNSILQLLVNPKRKSAYRILQEMPDTTVIGWMNSLP